MLFFKKKKEKQISPKFDYPRQIRINNILYAVNIIFSEKKSSSVSIKENKSQNNSNEIKNILEFRLSSFLSNKQVEEHFNSLLKRIIIKLEKQKFSPKNKTDFKKILEKEKFKFSDEIYHLEYTKNRGIKLKENIFYINIHSNIEHIEKSIIKLLILKYTPKIENYIKKLNEETYNFKINGFHLNNVKSKWGHCTHDNKIMLNLKLLNAPKEVLDYVIFHELSHIKHKNHSSSFWREVEIFCHNHKNLRRYLKENPPEVFIKID